MRRTLSSVFVLLASVVPALPGHAQPTITVPMDEVRAIAFPRAVATVYVGNPMVGDINMIDTKHAFVVGKSYGSTNILALDSKGHEVSNTYLIVPNGRGTMVTLQRGGTRLTMSCAGPRCEVAPRPGDTGYVNMMQDVEKHEDDGAARPQ